MIDRRLILCAVVSVGGHFVFARGLEQLPPRELAKPPVRVEVRVVAPPPEPPPPEPPKPPPPPPPKLEPVQVHERPRAKPIAAPTRAVTPTDVPPVDTAPTTATATTARPVFGVTMESTSQGGKTTVAVGNTTTPQPAGPATPNAPPPLAAPVAAYEVTKMPIPQGRCAGTYTDAARTAAIEGVVVLDLVVDERGRTRDIVVVTGLPHGLTDAAIAALRGCQFTPGERAGTRVPVRVRGFKIRFVLQDGG